MTERWYVAKTQPGREHYAAWHVGNQGFDYFLPELTTHSVRRELLFPGYLFVFFDRAEHGWKAINSTRGVHHLLPVSREHPEAVVLGYVEGLQDRVAAGEFDLKAAAEVSLGYAPGEEAVVIAGTMSGHAGAFQWQRDGRVKLLFSLLGRRVPVTIPVEQVQPKVISAHLR